MNSLQDNVRLGNPLQRMRSERRIALLVFNALLLMAALMQLLGYSFQEKHTDDAFEPSPIAVESFE